MVVGAANSAKAGAVLFVKNSSVTQTIGTSGTVLPKVFAPETIAPGDDIEIRINT